MFDVLELDAAGWRRAGEAWVPTQPFYAVLGDPIAHSLSPAMQNAGLAALGLNWRYLAFEVRPEELREAIVGAKRFRAGEDYQVLTVSFDRKDTLAGLRDFVQRLGPDAQATRAWRFALFANGGDIRRIAEQVGYSDRFFFSKDFKKHTGFTPSQFRARETDRLRSA